MSDTATHDRTSAALFKAAPKQAAATLLIALACVLTLSACGGGGDSTPIATPPHIQDPPSGSLPALPLQRPQDAGNAPILYVGSELHIGADVAPAPNALRHAARHGEIAVSHGNLADGIGRNELIDYLEHDTTEGYYQDRVLIPRIESTSPTIRIAQGTTEAMRDEAIRAVQLINAALPRSWQMQVSNTQGIPGTAPPTDSDILIQFLPVEEWPDGLPDHALGVAARHNTLELVDGEYRIATRFVRIFVDHTRTIGRDRMDTLVHEIIHALDRDHPNPELFPHTIMGRYAQSRDDHILYPLDREALLAWYSRLQHDDSTVASLADDLGPWSDTSTHLLGEFSADGQDVSFGVALRNGLAQPWATGPAPLTNLADNAALSGSASWSGRLLGFTPDAEPVAGAAELAIALDSLDGDLEFSELEYWSAGEAPGAAGSGTLWNDGDLSYDVEVRGNTFVRTAGDQGIVTGAFLGTEHQAMGGTLQRDDLSAAFGGRR